MFSITPPGCTGFDFITPLTDFANCVKFAVTLYIAYLFLITLSTIAPTFTVGVTVCIWHCFYSRCYSIRCYSRYCISTVGVTVIIAFTVGVTLYIAYLFLITLSTIAATFTVSVTVHIMHRFYSRCYSIRCYSRYCVYSQCYSRYGLYSQCYSRYCVYSRYGIYSLCYSLYCIYSLCYIRYRLCGWCYIRYCLFRISKSTLLLFEYADLINNIMALPNAQFMVVKFAQFQFANNTM